MATKYQIENKEKVAKYRKEYFEKNKEYYRKRALKWYLENREHCIERNKEYKKQINEKYPWKKTFASIKKRVSHSKHYKKYGLKNYLTEADVKKLWFRDKAYEMNLPSIDRKNRFKDYTKENCRFLEYIDNLRRPKGSYRKEK